MRVKIAFVAAALALFSPSLRAQAGRGQNQQSTTRSVRGVVADPAGHPVAGAVVQLKDTKTLQIRSFYTLADGSYHFAGLSTNIDYDLTANHDGLTSGTRTLTVFNGSKNPTVNLKLKKK